MILKEDFGKQVFQPLQENSKLFTELGICDRSNKLGHIYVVRITGRKTTAANSS